jgi:hypothetical protein
LIASILSGVDADGDFNAEVFTGDEDGVLYTRRVFVTIVVVVVVSSIASIP